MLFRSLIGLSVAALASATETNVQLPVLASQGDVAGVQTLLQRNVDVDSMQGDGMTALHWAAFRDDLAMGQLLLGAGAKVGSATRIGAITPLHLASKNGRDAFIEALLKAGANPNRSTDTGASPLMSAAMSGSVNAVRVLLDHKADVNAREFRHGQTPLMFAAWENRSEVIEQLTERGAHPELSSYVLALNEDRSDTDANSQDRRKGRMKSAQSGANSAMGGMTALLFAAREGHLESVRALFQAGADIDRVSGGDASSPMVVAIGNGHYTVAKYLLDQGADPKRANLDGLTPLYAAVHMRYAPVSWAPNPRTDQQVVGSSELIRSLLEAGADPNARVRGKLWFSPSSHDRGWVAHGGATALWRAAMSSDVEAMKLLVAGGADPKLKTDGGVTPLMVAAGIGWVGNFSENAPDSFLEAVKYCIELGNDVNALEKDGFTALHGAAAMGDNEVVQYLVDHGARVDLINGDGDSMADMAFGPSRFFIPYPDTVDLLVKLGSPFQDNCRSDQCVDGKFLGGAVAK